MGFSIQRNALCLQRQSFWNYAQESPESSITRHDTPRSGTLIVCNAHRSGSGSVHRGQTCKHGIKKGKWALGSWHFTLTQVFNVLASLLLRDHFHYIHMAYADLTRSPMTHIKPTVTSSFPKKNNIKVHFWRNFPRAHVCQPDWSGPVDVNLWTAHISRKVRVQSWIDCSAFKTLGLVLYFHCLLLLIFFGESSSHSINIRKHQRVVFYKKKFLFTTQYIYLHSLSDLWTYKLV